MVKIKLLIGCVIIMFIEINCHNDICCKQYVSVNTFNVDENYMLKELYMVDNKDTSAMSYVFSKHNDVLSLWIRYNPYEKICERDFNDTSATEPFVNKGYRRLKNESDMSEMNLCFRRVANEVNFDSLKYIDFRFSCFPNIAVVLNEKADGNLHNCSHNVINSMMCDLGFKDSIDKVISHYDICVDTIISEEKILIIPKEKVESYCGIKNYHFQDMLDFDVHVRIKK